MRLAVDLPSGRSLLTEVDDSLTDCGRELLGRLVAAAATLAAGGTIDVDVAWTTIRLSATADGVIAEEPDYAHPDRFTRSLSVTCRILDMQREVLRTVGAHGEPVTARQYVRVSREAMRSTSVVGYRDRDLEAPFTGWRIVSAASTDETEFGMHTVRELAACCLVWIVAMVLPVGWSFRCVGHTLVEAVSPEGQAHELLVSVDV